MNNHNENQSLLTADDFPEPARTLLKKEQRVMLVPLREGVKVFHVVQKEVKMLNRENG